MVEAADRKAGGLGMMTWCVAFAVAVCGAIALIVNRVVGPVSGFVLIAAAMLLLVPMVRAAEARSAERGCASPAVIRYNRRFVAASFGYMIGLGIAVFLHTHYVLPTAVTWILAVLPTLAIFAMIWVMARYLHEESDEYLRHRAIMAALGGLALVLGLGSFWGFLETFGLVGHVPGWASVPVFAIGLAMSQVWMKVRGA